MMRTALWNGKRYFVIAHVSAIGGQHPNRFGGIDGASATKTQQGVVPSANNARTPASTMSLVGSATVSENTAHSQPAGRGWQERVRCQWYS